MMSIRVFFAILLCKGLRLFSRLVHRGGTAMPGRFALKVCPELLAVLSKEVSTVAITGTNGKTTTSRMIDEAMRLSGLDYFANRSGANLISGITTEFVMNCTLFGKMKKHYAVIECDEAAAKTVFAQLRPKVIVVTNLFRDQLDRFGEVTHTLDNIREAISKTPESTVCLNADCSLTASLAGDLPNRIVFFGIDKGAVPSREKPELSDAAYCIRCKTEYEYDYIVYGHLGGFRCPKCGYRRHDTEYSVVDVLEQQAGGSTVVMNIRGERKLARINLPALYNVYNGVGGVAATIEMGIAAEKAIEALAIFKCGFGRMEQFDSLGKRGSKMMLVKNPAGCDQVLEFLENIKEKFILIICLNAHTADGTDISWVWDSAFEKLAAPGVPLAEMIVSGERAQDMRVRLKYAGIDDGHITVEQDYEKLVSYIEKQELPVFIMPTYTAMLELRQVIVKHCGGKEFWEG